MLCFWATWVPGKWGGGLHKRDSIAPRTQLPDHSCLLGWDAVPHPQSLQIAARQINLLPSFSRVESGRVELTRTQLPRLSLREIPAQSCTAHGICGLPLAQEVSGPEKGRGSDRQQRRACMPGTGTPLHQQPPVYETDASQQGRLWLNSSPPSPG